MHISGVERGTRDFSFSMMRRLAEVFGVSPGDLLSKADNPHCLADPKELRLIETYRQADCEDREKIVKVAETIAPFRTAEPEVATAA